ncbi:hypothetical protein ACFL3D_05860 [Candidatus Omnitrophota bacterium]
MDIRKIYNKSPAFIQNIALTIYGALIHKRRYGKYHNAELKELLSVHGDYNERIRIQEERCVSLLRHAIQNIPFYIDFAKKTNIMANDIQDQSILKFFPVITKNMIRENPDSFLAINRKNYGLIKLKTSGTTGSPFTVITDKICRQRHYAFWSLLRIQNGMLKTQKKLISILSPQRLMH